MKTARVWLGAFMTIALALGTATVVGRASGQPDLAAPGVAPVGPESTWLVDQVDTPGSAVDIAMAGNYAYVADETGGVRIVDVDVSNPAAPAEVGFYPEIFPDAVTGVVVVENTAYVANSSKGLEVLDVSNPANPVKLGQNYAHVALGVAVAGGYAYVAAGNDGLVVLDVTNPSNPLMAVNLDTPGTALRVKVTGGYAYVADSYSLRVINISDPTNPVEVGAFDPTDDVLGMDVAGGYAYVAAGGNMIVLDVSNPAAPTEVAQFNPPGYAKNVIVIGDLAYIADTQNGLRVVDVSNPAAPVEVEHYVDGFHDVDVAGAYVYAAGGWDGLVILGIASSASGQVTDGAGNPVADVTITATGGHTTATDGTGAYVLADLPAGTYTLTPAKTGYSFSPLSREVTVPPNASAQNFTAIACPVPLSGVTVSGPDGGIVGEPNDYTGTITPPDATGPIVYTWSPEPDSGQGAGSATYTFATPGVHEITLTAENCGGSVSGSENVVVEGGSAAAHVVGYQGQVSVDGTPYSGTGYFKFAVVPGDGGGGYLWSNDGKSPPLAAVALSVTDGLFSVLLGDTTVPGMTQPLTAAVFSSSETYLRIWFSTDGTNFTLLSPDRRIAAVPYALQSEEARHAAAAGDADTVDEQHAAAFQKRVSGECAVGSTIRGINADGTVSCQLAAPFNRSAQPLANTITTLDNSAGDVGAYTSVTIGADGLGLISYNDSGNEDLKVAHCSDASCTTATLTTLDSAGDVGWHTSVTIGADGLGLISYRDVTNSDLKVAHCSDASCTTATLTTLDSAGHVGGYTSVAIGADGLGLISYFDFNNEDLKVAHCSDVNCTTATLTTLDSAGSVGGDSSVAIGADGLGLISYADRTNDDLKVAHCSDMNCTTATLTTLDSEGDVGYDPSVTIGADGLGLISYFDLTNFDLKVAHCSDASCTTATLTTLDSAGHVGGTTSVTIGADGLGLISYYDYTNGNLKVAHCSDTSCTMATLTALDSAGDVGENSSVTIGADGLGLISYHGPTNGNLSLKVMHCSNPFCTPYFRRR